MQNAKDTFYETLRGLLAAENPERTIVVRGITRPGVLVEENELVSTVVLPDCFRLRWVSASTNMQGAMPTVAMQCEVLYETAGTAMNAGMDRGRCLAAMDAELAAALGTQPQNTAKNNYTGLPTGQPAAPMTTNIWWGDVVFGEVKGNDDRLARTATVTVSSYQEAGEL